MREGDLYCPIRKSLEELGYLSFVTAGVRGFAVGEGERCHRGEFPILPRGFRRKPDLVGFRWEGEGVDAVAVECKAGGVKEAIREGLGAALIYQRFFPRVMIGAEGGELDEVSRGVLEQYGVGWITPDPEDAILPPRGPLFGEEAFEEVREFGILCLTFGEVVSGAGEKPGFDHYRIGLTEEDGGYRRWICAYLRGAQYASFLEEGRAHFAINVEHRGFLGRVIGRIREDPKGFEGLLGSEKLKEFQFLLSCLPTRVGESREDLIRGRCDEVNVRKILKLMEGCLERRDRKPWMRISGEIWRCDEGLTREEYAERMGRAREALEPLYAFLSSV